MRYWVCCCCAYLVSLHIFLHVVLYPSHVVFCLSFLFRVTVRLSFLFCMTLPPTLIQCFVFPFCFVCLSVCRSLFVCLCRQHYILHCVLFVSPSVFPFLYALVLVRVMLLSDRCDQPARLNPSSFRRKSSFTFPPRSTHLISVSLWFQVAPAGRTTESFIVQT